MILEINNYCYQNGKMYYFKYLNIYIIIFLLLLDNHFYKYYHYCLDCINESLENPQCDECPLSFIFKGLNIISKEKTLDEIIYNRKSITRFGDGEFRIIFGENAGFQIYNETLSKLLLKVLNCKEKNLLIGINLPYRKKDLEERCITSRKFWKNYFQNNKLRIAKIIHNKKYYSSLISRFYLAFNDRKKDLKFVKKLKKIWDNRDVLIIEGEKTRIGIGNDLLNNTKSIKRIICPTINAFEVYDKIVSLTLNFNKDILVLIALGPTATVLAYDLYKLNYQVVDIGHIDIEYEFFLRKVKEAIKIPYKYVFEAKNGTQNINNITDINYYNQIVYKILK